MGISTPPTAAEIEAKARAICIFLGLDPDRDEGSGIILWETYANTSETDLINFNDNWLNQKPVLINISDISDQVTIVADGMVLKREAGAGPQGQDYIIDYLTLNDLEQVSIPVTPVDGEVLTYDSGGGGWLAKPPALPEFYYQEGDLIDVPAAWTDVLTLNFNVITAATFRVDLNFAWTLASVSQSAEFRYRVDGGAWREWSQEPKDTSNVQPFSYSAPDDLTAGAHVIELEAQKAGGGQQMDITSANIMVTAAAYL